MNVNVAGIDLFVVGGNIVSLTSHNVQLEKCTGQCNKVLKPNNTGPIPERLLRHEEECNISHFWFAEESLGIHSFSSVCCANGVHLFSMQTSREWIIRFGKLRLGNQGMNGDEIT